MDGRYDNSAFLIMHLHLVVFGSGDLLLFPKAILLLFFPVFFYDVFFVLRFFCCY